MTQEKNSLLLHVCCGPCASGVVPVLNDNEQSFETFFYNPNIEPESEYRKRLDSFYDYAKRADLIVHESEYDVKGWHESIGNAAGVYPLIKGEASYDKNRSLKIRRCRRCYAHRFKQLAKYAGEHGFEKISTSLSISPYQFADFIDLCLTEAAQEWQLNSSYADYTSRYIESIKISRELRLYRQNYCGCVYSKEEAELERAAKSAAKQA